MINLTTEQKMMLRETRSFMKKEVAPYSYEMDKNMELRRGLREKLGELGYFSLLIPTEYGGSGLSLTDFCLILEEISKVDGAVGVTIQACCTSLRPILLVGSLELKQKIFPELVSKGLLCGFAITEPEAGSDVASIESKGVRQGDKYILNGTKTLITNAGIADLYTVMVKTQPEWGHRGISTFIIPAETKGLSFGKREDKLGIRASATADLIMEDVEVPAENLIGKENDGFMNMMKDMEGTRPTIGAQALGIAEGALSYAFNYVKERRQFGKPLIEFQGVQFKLADMVSKVEAARALLYKTTKLIDEGFENVAPYSAMSKKVATDAAMEVTTEAVQLLGGYGYIKDYPVERMMRDAKVTQIYEGTNEIQRVVIAKSMQKLGYPFSEGI